MGTHLFDARLGLLEVREELGLVLVAAGALAVLPVAAGLLQQRRARALPLLLLALRQPCMARGSGISLFGVPR